MGFQRHLEKKMLLHLQKFGNFPSEIDLTTSNPIPSTDVPEEYSKNGQGSLISKKNKKDNNKSRQLETTRNENVLSLTVHLFDLWLFTKK
jgi:hypothetical protein